MLKTYSACRPGGTFINPLPPNTNSPFIANFEFVGTIDSAPYLCIPAALKYREQIGCEAAILNYNQTLARSAGKRVAALLGTEVLENKDGTLGNCCMSNVKLPLKLTEVQSVAKNDTVGFEVLNWITSLLVRDYGTFIAVMFYADAWWVRLSGQVYLEEKDFEWAAGVLGEICGRVLRGEFLEETKSV
jgi:hercynylcysteine S-oxide lyase